MSWFLLLYKLLLLFADNCAMQSEYIHNHYMLYHMYNYMYELCQEMYHSIHTSYIPKMLLHLHSYVMQNEYIHNNYMLYHKHKTMYNCVLLLFE